MQAVWVNGIPTDQISVSDRGLCYGDGLFETIAVRNGRPQLLAEHLERLQLGLTKLGFPEGVIDQLASELSQLPLSGDKILKVTVTRGIGARGYAPPQEVSATRIITLSDMPVQSDKPESGIAVKFCDYRLPIHPALAQLKHLNRLDQIMARSEWQNPAISEGLMLDTEDFVVEGTMSNVFWVNPETNKVETPLIDRCGVKGVMRDYLIARLVKDGISVVEGRFHPSSLMHASEVFICNSLIGIWPIVELNGNSYKIGPITVKLQSILEKELDSD